MKFCGAETSSPAFPVDVQIIEEDTWQVLSADNTARDIHEHPIRLMTGLVDQQPLPVGKIQINGCRWQAVIVDFDQYPVCQHDWIVNVYRQIVEQAVADQFGVISMPLLGVRHGCVTINESLSILLNLIKLQPETSTLCIWLHVPEEDVAAVNRQLARIHHQNDKPSFDL